MKAPRQGKASGNLIINCAPLPQPRGRQDWQGKGPGSPAGPARSFPTGTGHSRSRRAAAGSRAGMPLRKHWAPGQYVLLGKVDVTPSQGRSCLHASWGPPSQVPRRGEARSGSGASLHPGPPPAGTVRLDPGGS